MASIGVNPAPPSGLAGRSSKLRPSFVRLSVKGALGQWALVMSRMGAHLWLECLVPLVLNVPLSFMLAFLIFFGYINDWNRDRTNPDPNSNPNPNPNPNPSPSPNQVHQRLEPRDVELRHRRSGLPAHSEAQPSVRALLGGPRPSRRRGQVLPELEPEPEPEP